MPDAVIHPTPRELTAFGLGKLPERAAAAVAAHLESCPACRKAVANVTPDSFLGKVRAAGPDGSSFPPSLARPGNAPSSAGRPAMTAFPGPDLPPELASHPKYRILRELGRGGMGVVYQARQTVMNRPVVIKVINRSLLAQPGTLERFRREVQAAAQLSHPNIVTAYDAEQAGELHMLVMEFVPGQSLAEVLAKKGPLPVANACQYVRQVALGLQHAHERGMVHRDIKPQNLILMPKGQVKILDFGLAKVVSERGTAKGLTSSDAYMGTPDYCAPEQATDARSADIRADLYSLGCTLYCLLAGRPPFQEDTAMKTILAHLQKAPQPLPELRPDVPERLWRVVARLLAKEPGQRYQKPTEVVQALAPFVKPGAKPEPKSGSAPVVGSPEKGTMIAANTRQIKKLLREVPGKAPPKKAPAKDEAALPFGDLTDTGAASKEVRRASKGAKPSRTAWWKRPGVLAAAVGVSLALILMAGIVIKVKTPEGILVVEVNEPNPDVFVDGEKVTVTWHNGGKKAEIRVKPGTHKVEVKKDGFKAGGDQVTLENGGRRILTVRLEKIKDSEPPPLQARQARNAWLYTASGKDGSFRKETGKWWLETTPEGEERRFEEVKDTDEYVELFDRGRTMWLRLYTDHGEWRQGEKDGWNRWSAGRWVDAATLPKAAKRNEPPDINQIKPKVAVDEPGTPPVLEVHPDDRLAPLAFSPDCKRLATVWNKGALRLWDEDRGPEPVVLKGHTSRVTKVKFSPDGRRLAAGWEDGTIRVWDLDKGKEPVFQGKTNSVHAVAFSPDSKRLAAWSNPQMRLWDVDKGRELLALDGASIFLAGDRAFSPDGKLLATGGGAGQVRLWDAHNGRELLVLKGHTKPVWAVAFSPNSKRLTTASLDGTVRLWDVDNGRELLVLKGLSTSEFGGQFSLDGKRLVTSVGPVGEKDGRVQLWDIKKGGGPRDLGRDTKNGWVWAFCPDGKRLATTSVDGTVRLWDVDNGRELLVLKGHTNYVVAVAFSPNSKRLTTASTDGTVRIWDVDNGRELFVLKGHTGGGIGMVWAGIGMVYSADGKRLATWGQDGAVRVWNLDKGQQPLLPARMPLFTIGVELADLTLPQGGTVKLKVTADRRGYNGAIALEVAGLPDSVKMARATIPEGETKGVLEISATVDAAARPITNLRVVGMGEHFGMQPIRSSPFVIRVVPSKITVDTPARTLVLKGVKLTPPFSATSSPDGKRLATISDKIVQLWSLEREQEPLILAHTQRVSTAIFSPDGKRLVTASLDGKVRIWDPAKGQELVALNWRTGVFAHEQVAFSPDGKRLVTGSSGAVPGRIWDMEKGRALLDLKGSLRVLTVAFRPGGEQLATLSLDGSVWLWDAAKGRELFALKGHTKPVREVRFSPDGKRLATRSDDETVRLWDAGTGREQFAWKVGRQLGGGGSWLTFSPDGKRLAYGADLSDGENHRVRIWNLEKPEEPLLIKGGWVTFSPDGKRLANVWNGAVRVWDVNNGEQLLILKGAFRTYMCWQAFSPDGKRLATLSDDGTVRLWRIGKD